MTPARGGPGNAPAPAVVVRTTTADDFGPIIRLTRAVYPESPSWTEAQLASHVATFPDGQFVAVRRETGEVIGMAASLVVLWDDYDLTTSWRDFTAGGTFTNHDPARGRTLYGAEIMVSPDVQGLGIGTRLYEAREALVRARGLLRIRAGARLCGYHRHADRMDAATYAAEVVAGRLTDPTLTFQLRRGFRVLGVIGGYLRHDPESLGWAAVIEWVNDVVARAEGYTPAEWRPTPSRSDA